VRASSAMAPVAARVVTMCTFSALGLKTSNQRVAAQHSMMKANGKQSGGEDREVFAIGVGCATGAG